MIEITEHAYLRANERLNLGKDSFTRLAEKAFDVGKKQKDLKGKLKKYVSFLAKEYKSVPIIYGEFLFFFRQNKLITTYQIPTELKKYISL